MSSGVRAGSCLKANTLTDRRRWVHRKESLRVNPWLDHHTLMVNIIVGGRTTWKTTFKLMIMSYGWLSKMVHSFPKRQSKMGAWFPRSQKNSILRTSRRWNRIQRPKCFCILALVLMSILVFLSASQPKIYVRLSKSNPTREPDPNPTQSYWERREPDLNRTDFDPNPTRIDRLAYKHVIYQF